MRTPATQRSIMLIDDSEDARELIYWSLGGTSSIFHLIPIPDAEQALRHLEDTRVDLVILDFHMPGMDGIELLRRIQSTPHLTEIPVIIVTADQDPDLPAATRAAGASAFLRKPFTPTDLLTVVDDVLSGPASVDHLAGGQLTIQTLIDSIPYLAMILDENHRVIIGNKAFFEVSNLGVTDCPVHCHMVHGPSGQPLGCPLTESVRTGMFAERIVNDEELGELLVTVYPLDITTEDGRRLYFHIARPMSDMPTES